MNKRKWHMSACLAAILTSLLAVGCGRDDGLQRYTLTGNITYQGQPVPGGRIVFEPISAQGNSGPGSVGDIHEGSYHTRHGKGTVGGPHRVTIFGDDGSMPTETRDNSLFPPYRTEVDLPYRDSEQDFAVPST